MQVRNLTCNLHCACKCIFLCLYFFSFIREVQHYWSEHLECSGDLDSAIDQYRACGDFRSVARLLTFMGDTEEAIKVVGETKDKAATAYQQLEDVSMHCSILLL